MATTEVQAPGVGVKPAKPRRKYLPDEVEAGLLGLVLAGGSTRRAAELSGVPRSTLEKWAVEHRERIEAIRVEQGPRLERQAIEGFRAFVVRAEEVKAAALERVLDDLENDRCKDPGRALQAVSVAQGISVQRMLELDGRPSGVKPEASLPQIIDALKRLGAIAEESVASTAVELVSGQDRPDGGGEQDQSDDGRDDPGVVAPAER